MFEPHKHVSLRSLPGMHERCIRLGSAGKTFSFTAWKVRFDRQLSKSCRASARRLLSLGYHLLATSSARLSEPVPLRWPHKLAD